MKLQIKPISNSLYLYPLVSSYLQTQSAENRREGGVSEGNSILLCKKVASGRAPQTVEAASMISASLPAKERLDHVAVSPVDGKHEKELTGENPNFIC